MQKTVVVQIDRLKKHEKYQKYFKISQKFKAHDENNEYKKGDKVIIQESRPLSRGKRWRVVELVKRAKVEETGNIEDEVQIKEQAA